MSNKKSAPQTNSKDYVKTENPCQTAFRRPKNVGAKRPTNRLRPHGARSQSTASRPRVLIPVAGSGGGATMTRCWNDEACLTGRWIALFSHSPLHPTILSNRPSSTALSHRSGQEAPWKRVCWGGLWGGRGRENRTIHLPVTAPTKYNRERSGC